MNVAELIIRYKWGFDGASGQSEYKQKFNCDSSNFTDKSVLMTSLVPLRIQSGSTILWQNPRSSSTRYCRPITFEFTKETKEAIIEQRKTIQQQIDSLKATTIVVNHKNVQAMHKLELTMVDGKVVDYLTDTSTSNCNICQAKPSQMNDYNRLKLLDINTDNFEFGLSTLHCWIRFLECLLHIAYRIPIQRTDARGSDKDVVRDKKKEIQDAFRSKTGIIIGFKFDFYILVRSNIVAGLLLDIVKPGSGTTNDGNTSRRFFKDPKGSAELTGLDEPLINRFRVILTCLSSGEDIDIPKFQCYASETADRYHSLYEWYKMPPSVHKVLFHGADIISSLNLPIGLYSEEAQEARNKDFKNIREHHTRKMSRIHTNEDLIHGLLISSDPLISSFRTPFSKNKQDFDDEVVQLLKIH